MGTELAFSNHQGQNKWIKTSKIASIPGILQSPLELHIGAMRAKPYQTIPLSSSSIPSLGHSSN